MPILKKALCVLSLMPICLSAGAASEPVSTTPIEGIWSGKLAVGSGISLRVAVKIKRAADGTLTSTLDSLDQGAIGIPIETTTFTNGHVDLVVAAVHGEYKGELAKDGHGLTGTWTQGGSTLPLDLTRQEKEETLNRPQEPTPPFPYKSEEVQYANKSAGVTLAGTLTKPDGAGPFPAVLLITGSGPQNRDEEILGHKPFLILADYLTRRGFAVLRADDRGVGKSTGAFASATSEDFAGDALAGVEYLKKRADIDRKRIGLLGHSEGGLIAPMCATRSRDVAYIVLMAGPGLRGDEILQRQSVLIQIAAGVPREQVARASAVQKHALQIITTEHDAKAVDGKLRPYLEGELTKPESAAELTQANGGKPMTKAQMDSFIDGQVEMMHSPWMRFFVSYDPRPTLKKVKCPVLAIDGTNDLQVPPEEDLAEIEKALKAGGNKDVTTTLLPGLNHLFQPSKTGSPAEYAQIETTVDPSALKVIGDWLAKHANL